MKKEEKLDITKQKLTDATEKLMNECADPSKVTSRKIARKAGVQLAVYRRKDLCGFSGYDLTDRKQLKEFVDLQIDLFLKD